MATSDKDRKTAAAAHIIDTILNGKNNRVVLTCYCGERIIGAGTTRAESMMNAEAAHRTHKMRKMRTA